MWLHQSNTLKPYQALICILIGSTVLGSDLEEAYTAAGRRGVREIRILSVLSIHFHAKTPLLRVTPVSSLSPSLCINANYNNGQGFIPRVSLRDPPWQGAGQTKGPFPTDCTWSLSQCLTLACMRLRNEIWGVPVLWMQFKTIKCKIKAYVYDAVSFSPLEECHVCSLKVLSYTVPCLWHFRWSLVI